MINPGPSYQVTSAIHSERLAGDITGLFGDEITVGCNKASYPVCVIPAQAGIQLFSGVDGLEQVDPV